MQSYEILAFAGHLPKKIIPLADLHRRGVTPNRVPLKKDIRMSQQQDLGSFFKETRKILTDYLEARLEVYRLQGVKSVSKMAGYFIWVIVFLFLLWLLLIFAGIVTGLWLSDLTGSYLKGFGITTLLILVFCILIFVFRKALFVNPIIRAALQHSQSGKEEEDEDTIDV